MHSYVSSFFKNNNKIRIATARAGNVIGGGDWSDKRIIPDCIKSWSQNRAARLRNPNSTRPWQHVIEAVGGYLCLAINLKLSKKLHGESFNFGPSLSKEYSVLDLVKNMSRYWKATSWKADSKSRKSFYESGLLRLNCKKSKKNLNWKTILKFDELTLMVVDWYWNYYSNKKNLSLVTSKQIKKYQSLAVKRGLKWAKI